MLPSRVEESLDWLLKLLARHSATATFFTVSFRAPSFSIVSGLEWAFNVLIEERVPVPRP